MRKCRHFRKLLVGPAQGRHMQIQLRPRLPWGHQLRNCRNFRELLGCQRSDIIRRSKRDLASLGVARCAAVATVLCPGGPAESGPSQIQPRPIPPWVLPGAQRLPLYCDPGGVQRSDVHEGSTVSRDSKTLATWTAPGCTLYVMVSVAASSENLLMITDPGLDVLAWGASGGRGVAPASI